jgi:homospermidine synthase
VDKVSFNNRIIILGFGSIGSGLVPLLFKHFKNPNIMVISSDRRNEHIAEKYGLSLVIETITKNNYSDILQHNVRDGDFLVNLTVDVDSLDIIKWCAEHKVLYIDTVVEPWAGYYVDSNIPVHERSNYYLRQRVIDYRRENSGTASPTAIIAHGANPGLVNHFVKAALLEIAKKNNIETVPIDRQDWITLAKILDIKTIHIAERDTQRPSRPKARGEFVNTWSVEGFISEGSQPAELGWGTHEKYLPEDAKCHPAGCGSAIYIEQPGLMTKVRTWTPDEGPMHAWVITHNESISIADYFSGRVNGVTYRPTVHYAYHPCDSAVASMHEIVGKCLVPQQTHRIITDEVTDGVDELGVLLMGNPQGSIWYGNNLSISQAREAAPHNNATSLQVVAPVVAGMIWAIENPRCGILEADELPYDKIIDYCGPYLGNLVNKWTDWTPLDKRGQLFDETVDTDDPWQFTNFRVS